MSNRKERVEKPITVLTFNGESIVEKSENYRYETDKNASIEFNGHTYYCRRDQNYHVKSGLIHGYAVILSPPYKHKAKIDLCHQLIADRRNDLERKKTWLEVAKEKMVNLEVLLDSIEK